MFTKITRPPNTAAVTARNPTRTPRLRCFHRPPGNAMAGRAAQITSNDRKRPSGNIGAVVWTSSPGGISRQESHPARRKTRAFPCNDNSARGLRLLPSACDERLERHREGDEPDGPLGDPRPPLHQGPFWLRVCPAPSPARLVAGFCHPARDGQFSSHSGYPAPIETRPVGGRR